MILLGLLFPLVGFILLTALADRINRWATNLIGCITIFLSFLTFVSFFYRSLPVTEYYFEWIPVAGIQASFSLHLDSLSLLMALIITGVGFLIHLYATGYMEHEEDFARFFACLNFFVCAMLLLVLASNLLLLFVGWEGVGLASYLLIGYWYHRPAAAQAATKAFVVNRVGDFGFLIALLILFVTFGTSDIQEVNQRSSQLFTVGAPLLTLLTLLLFMGATGKSAQIPLHTWLPDAMEGPTPVSALIHAATMVTAGVYLIVRLHPLFLMAPTTLNVVALIGAMTSLYAALSALGQTDLKRVLAYSTVSQLGLMFLACGCGAFYAAMFHLTTHAFMKSLLFLAAGNLVHMLHGTTDMDKMGGLIKKFPITHVLFLIGVLAMAGIPPLAAFFSKDLILDQAYASRNLVLYAIGLFSSMLTAFYLMRAYCLAFTGTSRLEPKIIKVAHEAPLVMTTPVSFLALLSIFGGLLGYGLGKAPPLQQFLNVIPLSHAEQELSQAGFHFTLPTLMAIAGAFIGVIAAALIYTRYAAQLGATRRYLTRAFYIDELYDTLFVTPFKAIATGVGGFIEPKIIEGSLLKMGRLTTRISSNLQRVQSGEIRSYAAWLVLGAVLFLLTLVKW